MKCNQYHPAFELVSSCPFHTTITITPWARIYIYIYIYIYECFRQHLYIYIYICNLGTNIMFNFWVCGGARGVMVKNGHDNPSSNPGQGWLHFTSRLGSLALVRQPVKEKENSKFRPVKLRLKIDLVSHPVRVEGVGKHTHTHTHTYIYIVTKLFRESGTNLLQFRLSDSSGYLIPDEPLRRNCSRLVPDSWNNFVTILLYLVLSTFLHL